MASSNGPLCFICRQCKVTDFDSFEYHTRSLYLKRFFVVACRHFGFGLDFNFNKETDSILKPEKTLQLPYDNFHFNKKDNERNKELEWYLCGDCALCIRSFCDLYNQLISVRLKLAEKTGRIVELIERGNKTIIKNKTRSKTENLLDDFRAKFQDSAKQSFREAVPSLKLRRLGPAPEVQHDHDDERVFSVIVKVKAEQDSVSRPNKWKLAETTFGNENEDNFNDDNNGGDYQNDSNDSFEDIGDSEPVDTKDNQLKSNNRNDAKKTRPLLKCDYCDRTFNRRDNKQSHERTHTGEKPFKCRFCGDRFSHSTTRNVHERLHTGNRPYRCKICDKTFTTRGKCGTHQTTAHRIPYGSGGIEVIEKAKLNDTTDQVPLTPQICKYCGKKFDRRSDLKVHKRVHKEAKKHRKSLMVTMKAKVRDNPLQCRFCDKVFPNNSQLINHERSHTGKKPFQCNHCDQRFVQSSSRNVHERNMHGDPRPFKCGLCEKTFVCRGDCKTHQWLSHKTKNGEIMEDTSQQGCRSSTSALIMCNFCPNRPLFGRQTDLETHQKIYHKQGQSELKVKGHLKCRFCERRFKLSQSRAVHERLHTGQKPYKCSICERAFAKHNNCKSHIKRIHKDEKDKGRVVKDLAISRGISTELEDSVIPKEREKVQRSTQKKETAQNEEKTPQDVNEGSHNDDTRAISLDLDESEQDEDTKKTENLQTVTVTKTELKSSMSSSSSLTEPNDNDLFQDISEMTDFQEDDIELD